MVDIETLGTVPGCAILSIAYLVFDPVTGQTGACWDAKISQESCGELDLCIDPATIRWWMQQSDAARQAAFLDGPRVGIVDALTIMAEHFREFPNRRVWAHGATFDPVMLDYVYRATTLETPWGFRDVRDTRTLFDLAGIASLEPYRLAGDVHHDPLADCAVQVRAVVDAYRRLGLSVGAEAA
ncbi:3'-5' exonuclease [Methylobacterium sp. D53M]